MLKKLYSFYKKQDQEIQGDLFLLPMLFVACVFVTVINYY